MKKDNKQELLAGENSRHFETTLKNKLFQHPGLEIRRSSLHGYGVFTKQFIYEDDLIEECAIPYQTIEPGYEYLDGKLFRRNIHTLDAYRFNGPKDDHGQVRFWMVATGNAMIFNHKQDANTIWRHDIKHRLITFKAIRDVQPGEELCFNYGEKYKQNYNLK